MCEKRTRKITKNPHLAHMREARRMQRLQRVSPPPTINENNRVPCPQELYKMAQDRVITELAWRTVALMQKNRIIQQKIIALKKETHEFVEAVMRNPENRKRYLEHIRLYGAVQAVSFKVEPEA